jgi:uncharacterized protein
MDSDQIAAFPNPIRRRAVDDGWPAFDLDTVLATPEEALQRLGGDVDAAGGALVPDPDRDGAVGFTMFDAPGSEDNSVTVLLAHDHIADLPSQSLVRIKSKDGRRYLGTVTAGPFAEPDGLRADSNILVTTVTRGGIFVPPYHGRVQVEILGEEQDGQAGALLPPRYRPLPNSPVVVLDDRETAEVLKADGDIQLGQVVGRDGVSVAIPSTRKDVLPRHLAILGTTGSGKSTSVARLIQQAQAAGCAVILLDVEGEYSFLHEPTASAGMVDALQRRGLTPAGIPETTLYHLVGRETANPNHPNRRSFSLQFARLSPYAIMDILDLSDPQRGRFLQAYDVAKSLLRQAGIFPERGDQRQERLAMEIDDLARGWPRLTLSIFLDVVSAGLFVAQGGKTEETEQLRLFNPAVDAQKEWLVGRFRGDQRADHAISWRALRSRLWGLHRLRVFDQQAPAGRREEVGEGEPLRYNGLRTPGTVTVLDLSDTSSPALNNLVIADLLSGVLESQDREYARYEQARRDGRGTRPPARVLIVIEEAHEFLSAERIDKMPVLFGQVARIARRGRKRWLGLVFVTQLPQHLPRELFGLVNSYVLHKIADPQVVTALRRTVSGIDESLWRRLPGLAPGQAIVALSHLARPLLVAMDPAPSKLRLVD